MTAAGTSGFIPMEEDSRLTEDDDTPHEVHVVPESNQSRWSPIEDLDCFFIRMYQYHQRHGMTCIMLQQGLELLQFVFIVVFSVFLFHCVDYPILFRDKMIGNDTLATKISLSDAILPVDKALDSMGVFTWSCILVALVFWILRVIRVLYEAVRSWEIKIFFNTVLNIPDEELDNVTWHEVQRRLRLVQKDHEMCIHKRELTELDICHRILRFKNYMVAMVNKSLLPVQINVPLVGPVLFFTRGLKYNLELLLFRGPWSPFENSWQLKDDYKRVNKRKELAEALSKHIMWTALINLVLCPVILLWQVLYSFFNYAEIIKREPGTLGLRCWSLYARLYLRHFNELDHELNARLNRAYRPASKYMNIFTSPVMAVVAKNVVFFVGALFAVLVCLTVYDEDVLNAQHVLTDLTLLGAILAGARVFIPDENLVWCPEQLMAAVLAHVHYLPDSWHGQAHTSAVRSHFSSLFPYKCVYLLHELLSPVMTPFILLCKLRPKALDIVDFFRQFTVDVVGVGDVCSFAQMDIRRHGNTAWQPHGQRTSSPDNNQYTQAEDGKIELSLVHFTLTNPEWKPPAEAEEFVERIRGGAARDMVVLPPDNLGQLATLGLSLHSNSMSGLGAPYDVLAASYLHFRGGDEDRSRTNPFMQSSQNTFVMRGAVNRSEGPALSDRGLLVPEPGGLRGAAVDPNNSLGASMFGVGPEVTHADMAASALYLHSLHHRQTRRRGYVSGESSVWQRPHQAMSGIAEQPDERRNEKLPLLHKP